MYYEVKHPNPNLQKYFHPSSLNHLITHVQWRAKNRSAKLKRVQYSWRRQCFTPLGIIFYSMLWPVGGAQCAWGWCRWRPSFFPAASLPRNANITLAITNTVCLFLFLKSLSYRGALEMVHLEVAAWFVQDTLKGEKVLCLSMSQNILVK